MSVTELHCSEANTEWYAPSLIKVPRQLQISVTLIGRGFDVSVSKRSLSTTPLTFFREAGCAGYSIAVAMLPIDRPDACRVFLEWVDVHHPAENYGMKGSARGIARFLGGDRSS